MLKEARTRKPTDYSDWTFFSRYDTWKYHWVSDDRLCDFCKTYALVNLFAGNDLRVHFPDMMIEDENVIKANVHLTLWGKDTCRCYLTRVFEPMDPRKEKDWTGLPKP